MQAGTDRPEPGNRYGSHDPQPPAWMKSDSSRRLAPAVLQATGVVLFVAFCIFWGLTGRESGLLVGASLTLATFGVYGDVARRLKDAVTKSEEPPRE